MKRIVKLFIPLLLVCLTFTGIISVGCSNKNKIASLPKEINIFDVHKIVFNDNIVSESVVATSSDESILVVENNVILAKNFGKAKITLKSDGIEQTKTIKVVNKNEGIIISEKDFGLINGQSITLNSPVIYKGKILEGVIKNVKSSDTSVVSVENDKLTAVGLGSADVEISVAYNKKVVATKTIKVTVNENMGITTSKTKYVLYPLSEVRGVSGFKQTAELDTKVYINNKQDMSAVVEWTSNNPEIAVVENDVVIAKKHGNTTIVGKYIGADNKQMTISVEVLVDYVTIDFNDDILIDLGGSTTTLDGNKFFGENRTIEKLRNNTTGAEIKVTDNKVETKKFVKSGEYDYSVFCKEDAIICDVDLVVADYVVYDKTTLNEIGKFQNEYIALGNNIDNVGEYYNEYVNTSTVFTGTFNGMGYNINNITFTNGYPTGYSGLFRMVDGATFKNVSFTNVNYAEKKGLLGVFSYRADGVITVSDCFVEVANVGKEVTRTGAFFGIKIGGSVTFNNTIVKSMHIKDDWQGNGAFMGICGTRFAFNNTYAISGGPSCGTNETRDNVKASEINLLAIVFKDEQSFINAKSLGDVDVSTYSKYWDLTKDIPVFKSISNN